MKKIFIFFILSLSAFLSWADSSASDSVKSKADGFARNYCEVPDLEKGNADDIARILYGGATCCLLEDNRPLAVMFTAEGGYSRVLDSYLTPITYTGWHTGLGFEHNQACGFNPERWQRQLSLGVVYDNVENRVGNNTMHHLRGTARWALMHKWYPSFLHGKLTLMGGGMTWLHGGIIYNNANSNNPVSVKGHWTLGLQGIAQYEFKMGRIPVYLRYQAALPVAGVWFSPEYDESFYEIYLGNHRNLMQVGWWGNRFDLDHQITADFRLGGTILRIGYHGTFERSWANRLNTHITTHAIVIGVGCEFFTRGSHYNPKALTISSY